MREIHAASPYLRPLTGRASPSTLRAQSPKNKLAFANHPLAQRTRRRPRYLVPLHVLHIAAAVADKVMVARAGSIESCGAALDRHFAHQPRLRQVPQIVI